MLLELFLTLAQDPGDESQAAGSQDPVPVFTTGSIEAPVQPTGRSSATMEVLPRTIRKGLKGNFGRVKARVGSLIGVRGREENVISGTGLVVGLAGTGDSGLLATQMLSNLLLTGNLKLDPNQLEPENLAAVHIEAILPAGMEPGQRIDARVSAIGGATSLQGGILIEAELFDIAGERAYATVSGPITLGGYTVSADAASATKNHTTVGTLPAAAVIQREVPTSVVSEHGYIYLDSRHSYGNLGNMVRIAEAVNRLYPGVAQVLPDGRSVRVTVPQDLPESQYVAYLDTLLRQEVETETYPRVSINERTGTIVMTGDVRLQPGTVTLSNLWVTIAETEETSQPGAFSGGETTTLPRSALNVAEENNPLVAVPAATSLEEVVEVLNTLGATPRDLITILVQMHQEEMLVAEIRRL